MILLPQLMSQAQPNVDIRTAIDRPLTEFNAKRYKPGRDYFNGMFCTLLVIFFYTVLFYKNIVGVSKTEIDLNHFTIWQVVLLFVIMSLMLAERMLYMLKQDGGASQYALTIRFVVYMIEVIAVHTVFTLVWPCLGHDLSSNGYSKIYYCLWLAHFAFSAL